MKSKLRNNDAIFSAASKYFGVKEDEFLTIARTYEKEQHKFWYDNYNNDNRFSFYDSKEYLYTTIMCYIDWTRDMVIRTRNFADKMNIKPKTIIDHYNGCGLSTLLLKELFPDSEIHYYTDCKKQEDLMQHFNSALELNYKVHADGLSIYDLVCSFATIEHYEEPIKFWNEKLAEITNKNIIFTADFTTIGAGHFKQYKVDDKILEGKQMSRYFNKYLKNNGFEIIWKGWNARPRAVSCS